MLSSPTTISELQICIHDRRRLAAEGDTEWITFDDWVNQRVATLCNLFPNEHVTSLPLSVLFMDLNHG